MLTLNRRSAGKSLVLLLGSLLFSALTRSEESASFPSPGCDMLLPGKIVDIDTVPMQTNTHHEVLAGDLRVGTIWYSKRQVFDESDPEENRYLFRLANQLHVDTRTNVLRRQLLFVEGDPYIAREIEESERILRTNSFLSDARIIPLQRCGNQVDLLVVTRDVWTTYPVVYLSISGGDSTKGFGFSDSNFLGTGNNLHVSYKSDVDRDSTTFNYVDPEIFDTRYEARLAYSDNSDGDSKAFYFDRPFFSFESEWSQGVSAQQLEQEDSFYYNGEKVDKFTHRIDRGAVYYGKLIDFENSIARRWEVGFAGENNRFDPIDHRDPPVELDIVPDDRAYNYPWIGFEQSEESYSLYSNLRLLYRPEDIYLGERHAFKLGYAAKEFDSTDDAVVFDYQHETALDVGPHHLLRHELKINGYWLDGPDSFENLLANYQLTYYNKDQVNRGNYLSLTLTAGKNLTEDQQLTIGGDSDLRGYPSHIQSGDYRFLITAERRYYYDLHLFNLFRFGSAIFMDVGQAWNDTDNSQARDANTVLVNAGFGLRMNSSKASSNSVLHIDLAFPFTATDHPKVDSYQWYIAGKSSF